MADESKTYTDVDRSAFERLREAIAPYVALPPGDSGTSESRGVKGSFDYNESAQTLTLTIHKLPMFVPSGMLWNAVEQALGRR